MGQQCGEGQTPEPLPWKTSGKMTPAPIVQGRFGRVGRTRAPNIRNNQPHIAVVDTVTVSFPDFPPALSMNKMPVLTEMPCPHSKPRVLLNTKDAGVMGERPI